mgnify:CR=1 FL=1
MNQVRLHAISGFLGGPSDWSDLSKLNGIDLIAHDAREWLDSRDVNSWGTLVRAASASLTTVAGRKSMLLGYSLGGRIAMHLLAATPERWAGAMLVSAHPGLSEVQDRAARVAADEAWARRFDTEPWEKVLDAWEHQPVLATSRSRPVRAAECDRAVWTKALRSLSLGQQRDFRPFLRSYRKPVAWVAGARDVKFVTLARQLREEGIARDVWICDEAGHRVPWDAEVSFAAHLSAFVSAQS